MGFFHLINACIFILTPLRQFSHYVCIFALVQKHFLKDLLKDSNGNVYKVNKYTNK